MLQNGIEVCGPDAEYLAAYEDTGLTPKEVAKLVSPEMTKVARLLLDMLEGDTAQRMAELLRAVKEGRQPSCWIPVTERFPDPEVWALCLLRRGDYEALQFDSTADEWRGQNPKVSYFPEAVTHWLPIPELPEGFNNEGGQ